MQCSVCKNEYLAEEYVDHIDQCKSLLCGLAIDEPRTPKRLFPFKGSNQKHNAKKPKSNCALTTFGVEKQASMEKKDHVPLAEKLRPTSLSDYIGQKHVVGCTMVLHELLRKGSIPSLILWGPPGCGKSSLANVISQLGKQMYGDQLHKVKLSATSSGVGDIRNAVDAAKKRSKLNHQTIVFMDEIHRFNKLQQDIFLPHVEAGTFTLIGTTTENPSYSLNSALLSRCRVFNLKKLTTFNVIEILEKAIRFSHGKFIDTQNDKSASDTEDESNCSLRPNFVIHRQPIEWLAEVCDGDARVAINGLELALKTKVENTPNQLPQQSLIINLEDIKEIFEHTHMLSGQQTNNSHHIYSALHKSIRGSDANAALYWLARIMALREDPVNIGRRLVRISSEDIGLSDPDALGVAVHATHACEMIGMPECDVILGQCVVYLAKAPKSRLIYDALKTAENTILNHKGPQPAVPLHIRCRAGEGKLRGSLGRDADTNLLRKEECTRNRLPDGLDCVNFFRDA